MTTLFCLHLTTGRPSDIFLGRCMIDNFVVFARSILSDNWFAWFYQYLFGGLFFFGSLWVTLRAGTVYKGLRADRWIIWVLVIGFFLFAGIHLVWIFSVEAPPGK